MRLLADSGSETDAVIDVGNALSTGRIPAEYRALLYRALAHAPNLRVTEQAVTLDGRTGTALGINAYGDLGRRQVSLLESHQFTFFGRSGRGRK